MSKKALHSRQILRTALPVLLPILFLAILSGCGSGRRPARSSSTGPDTTPPRIFLTRDNRYFVMPGEEYEEEGYAAYDDRDGDISNRVEVSKSKDMVQYKVKDSAGNITIRFRRIPYGEAASDQ